VSKDVVGVLTTYYYDGAGFLFVLERNGDRYYVSTDQVGSPKVVSDAVGVVVKKLEYNSFGNLASDSNTAFYLPIGFAGGIEDTDTGFVRFGFRDYDSVAGRWTAKDPIVFEGGQSNLYAYCDSDPINYIDSTGQFAIVPIAGGALLGGGSDLGAQLLRNGGKWGCVNWSSVGKSALIGGVGAGFLGKALKVEETILAKGNLYKIISKELKAGFRIDPAHHNKLWGHTHFWKW